jgi:hypothetical protein
MGVLSGRQREPSKPQTGVSAGGPLRPGLKPPALFLSWQSLMFFHYFVKGKSTFYFDYTGQFLKNHLPTCLADFLPVFFLTCASVYLCIYLPIPPTITVHLLVYLPMYLHICLSAVYLFTLSASYLSTYLSSVYLPTYLYIHVCLSICFFTFLPMFSY